MNKKTYVRDEQLLLENLIKKFFLILIESTQSDRNATRSKFLSYKCTLNNKNKVIIDCKKLYKCTWNIYSNKKPMNPC